MLYKIPDCCPEIRGAPPGGRTATAPGGGFFCKLGLGPNGSPELPKGSAGCLTGATSVDTFVLLVLVVRFVCDVLCAGRGLASSDGVYKQQTSVNYKCK